jgi:hypothetical protein
MGSSSTLEDSMQPTRRPQRLALQIQHEIKHPG